MEKPIIEIKNISKKYKITHQQGGYIALRDVLASIFKNPFKFIKYKTKEVVGLGKKEEFWALKDINLEIKRGEVIGIIGSNGAGKSTLLKILSQITPPTTGEIKMRGKVGSLLEVGTGFHPELTGRENIFLNGAILGMSRKEIAEKFDRIVEFSGIEKFLDTPVKRYSSGMYVRLAFAVAAHMEPDILIIDEVLAVGDAEFQKKCLGKMNEITKKDGRTILFVSHNLSAIQNLCPKTILLKDGVIDYFGETKKTIEKYLKNRSLISSTPLEQRTDRQGKGNIKFVDIQIIDDKKSEIKQTRNNLEIILKYTSKYKHEIKNAKIVIALFNEQGIPVLRLDNYSTKQTLLNMKTNGMIICEIKNISVNRGIYSVHILIRDDEGLQDYITDASTIEITEKNEVYNFKNL